MSKVIFEGSDYWGKRYQVEAKGADSYWVTNHWYVDRTYDAPESAIARAENLLHKRDIEYVRVIDTEAEEEGTEEE